MIPIKKRGAMPNLPQDIIMNILSRLPIKPLGQFKSVSKSWHSLISSPHFVKLHLNQAISDPNTNHFRILTLFPFHSLDYESPSSFEDVVDDDAIVDLGYPLEDLEQAFEIVGSCNGLICLLHCPNQIILWNPSIKQSRELPNQSTSFFYGFGYDSSIDDYKVVRAARSASTNDDAKIEVFNLKENSWRKIEGINSNGIIQDAMGKYANGALHWLVSRGAGSDKHDIILTLDLAQEKFWEMSPPPRSGSSSGSFHTLGVFEGWLSLLFYGNNCGLLELWVRKEYGVIGSWTRLIVIPEIEILYCGYLVPVCLTKNGEVVVDVDGTKLVRYNLDEKTCRDLKNRCEQYFEWVVYVESLVSPHGDNGIDHPHQAPGV